MAELTEREVRRIMLKELQGVLDAANINFTPTMYPSQEENEEKAALKRIIDQLKRAVDYRSRHLSGEEDGIVPTF